MAEAAKTTARATRKATTKPRVAAKRKPAAKRAAPKKPVADLAAQAQETGRSVFLAGLGVYGKAYDQAQERLGGLQKRLEQRRKKADSVYKELVKRGEKVEKDAKVAIKDIELPKLELDALTDRKKIEAQLKKAKARFEDMKGSIRLKTAA